MAITLKENKLNHWSIYSDSVRVGFVEIKDIDGEGSIQIFINKNQQGKGYGTVGYKLGSKNSTYDIIYAHMRKNNIASYKAAIKAGYIDITKPTDRQATLVWDRNNMYSKSSVKSYARGTKAKRSYRNPIPVGLAEGVGWTAGAKLADVISKEAGELNKKWRKGKKSKLAKSLHKNPSLYDDIDIKRDANQRKQELMRETGINLKEANSISRDTLKEEYRIATVYRDIPKGKLSVWISGWKRYGVNPGNKDPISPEVEDLSKEWHGREIQDYSEVEEIESFDEDLVDLGELEELGIWGLNGNLFTINFKKDRPTLVCDGEGRNLEVVGGDQELDLKGQGVDHKGKRLIPIGYIYSIVYETDKHHLEGSSGYPEPYEHYFAEEVYKKSLNPDKYENTDDWFKELCDMGVPQKCIEKGLLPTAVYNQTDGKIMIAGGNYEVTELGIRD